MDVSLGIPTVRASTAGDSHETAAALHAGAHGATKAELDQRAGDAPTAPGLLDRHGRLGTDLRISLTDKCNLRCTYCMPADGMDWMPPPSLLTAAEVVRLVDIAVAVHGVRDLRLTGGEPLIRPDLEDIIAGVRSSHPDLPIAITTNGIGLTKRAATLAAAGLTRLNVSLDTIDADTFRALARRNRLADVLAGIDAALAADLHPVKVNAVLMRGENDDQAPDLLAFALERGLDLRFIEQMPLDGDHGWTREGMVTAREVRELLSQHWRLVPDDVPRGGAPAELWRVLPLDSDPDSGSGSGSDSDPNADPDAVPSSRTDAAEPLGRVGVIASVTEPFCSACTRTRITADGKVRSCLFSHEEFDLASAMRSGESDDVVARLWQQAMWLKPAAHGMEKPGLDSDDYVQPDRTMSAIGG
ncbi:GTP 3',8-cyclase MoaA [Brevibacterium sp. Mu109]|uniref:GTP 3',8-cyclase MoaA n=1 Tax=Brevibacterium sp. Mu109 TaxID=1255669 RepID=UPI000C7833AE|nr:GTP 3',8-cyclase MoaA [Brevibacterium sp. Mu109]